MPYQIIYVLENEGMPGIIKIGRTSKEVEERVSDLSNSTSVPYPFRCVYAATVNDAVLVERHLHSAFAAQRIRKEFFRLPAHCVVSVLELIAIDVVTPVGVASYQPLDTHAPAVVVALRPRTPWINTANEQEKLAVLKALTQANRPLSNIELASLMGVTTGECSKRVSALGDLVRKERNGRMVAISLRRRPDAPRHNAQEELNLAEDKMERQ